MIHLRREKYQDILLKAVAATSRAASKPTVAGVSLFSVGMTADVDRLAEQAQEKLATLVEGSLNGARNFSELVLLDADSYRAIVSGGPVEERNFEDLFPAPNEAAHETD